VSSKQGRRLIINEKEFRTEDEANEEEEEDEEEGEMDEGEEEEEEERDNDESNVEEEAGENIKEEGVVVGFILFKLIHNFKQSSTESK
jgi:hypothetical protein